MTMTETKAEENASSPEPVKAEPKESVKSEQKGAPNPSADAAAAAAKGAAQVAAAIEAINRKRPFENQGGSGTFKRERSGVQITVKLVCPDSKAGAVIGKGGCHIKALREQTGSDVLVEKSIPGTLDRIVQLSSGPSLVPEKDMSPVQLALLMVIDKIVEDDTPKGRPPPQHVEFRLLVDRSLAAAVMSASSAPQGTVLLDIRKYCGAAVIVAPPTGRPAQAAINEELIKVAGSLESVREGMRVVVERMRETVNGQRPSPLPSKPHPAAAKPHEFPPDLLPGGKGPRVAGPGVRPAPLPGAVPAGPPVETEYRLVVMDNRIGCILGKGGQLAKTIREQTGSDMRIERLLPNAIDRLVVCVSSEPPESDFCAAADAMMVCLDKLVQDHMIQTSRGTIAGPFRTVLLLRPIQAAVVLARGASTILQIQGETRAHVAVLPPDALPRCAEPGDSALLMEGPPDSVLAAVRAVSIVLRGCQVRAHLGLPQVDNTGAILQPQPAPVGPPPPPQRMPVPPGPMLVPPPGVGAALTPPPPPKGPLGRGPPPEEQIQSAVQRFLTTMAAQQAGQTPASSKPGAGPPGAPPTFGAGAQPLGPFGAGPLGGGPSAVRPPGAPGPSPGAPDPALSTAPAGVVRVTMTVAQTQASALLGKGGATISHIRQASGAKVKLHDQPTITGDRELEITGTAEQATTARNMISSVIGAGPAAPPPAGGSLPPPPPMPAPPPAASPYGAAHPYGQPAAAPTATAPYPYGQPAQPPSGGAPGYPGAAPAAVASGYYQPPSAPAQAGAAPGQAYSSQPPAAPQYDPQQYAQQYAQYYAQQQQAAAQAPATAAAPALGSTAQYPGVATHQYGQQPAPAPATSAGAPAGGAQQYGAAPTTGDQSGGAAATTASQQAQYAAYQLQVQQYNAAVLAQQQAAQQQQQQPGAGAQGQAPGGAPAGQVSQYGAAAGQQYPGGGQSYSAAGQQQYGAPAGGPAAGQQQQQYGAMAGGQQQQQAYGQSAQQPGQQYGQAGGAGGYQRSQGGAGGLPQQGVGSGAQGGGGFR